MVAGSNGYEFIINQLTIVFEENLSYVHPLPPFEIPCQAVGVEYKPISHPILAKYLRLEGLS